MHIFKLLHIYMFLNGLEKIKSKFKLVHQDLFLNSLLYNHTSLEKEQFKITITFLHMMSVF